MTPNDFYRKWVGVGANPDGAFGAQCVDLFDQFCIENGFSYPHVNGAKDFYNKFHANEGGLKNNFISVSPDKMQDGDWVIWGESMGGGYGHVAMFRKYSSGGNAIFFGQNQRAVSLDIALTQGYPGTQDSLSTSGIILVMRPKMWAKGTPGEGDYEISDPGFTDVGYEDTPSTSGPVFGTLTTGTSKSTGKVASTQVIEKKHTSAVTVSNPYATVEVYTETAKLSINQSLTIAEENLDLDILSISTSRDIGEDCPTFTISLSYRREWYEKIGSNDLVIIKMTRPPEKEGVVFYGLIDDKRKSESYESGISRTITLTGRGFGKALSRFNVGSLSEVNMMAGAYGFLNQATLDGISAQPPATVVKTILEFCLGLGCDYEFSNEKKLSDYLVLNFKNGASEGDTMTGATSLTSYSGSLWNLMKEIMDAPFNEMFWEIVDDKPNLVFRPTPFEEEDWTELYRIEIPDYDLVDVDLGVSDLETYVVYKVNQETFSGDTETLYLPLWYEPYYKKYGLSRLEISSKYMGRNADIIAVKTEKLFNWNILNNSMENGTITVRGKNSYKVGTRVILESTGVEYYVESVSHSFTFFEGWTTTLALTRGLTPDKRYASPWGKAVQVQPEDAVNIFGYSLDTGKYVSDTYLDSSSSSSEGTYDYSSLSGGGPTPSPNEKYIWDTLLEDIGNEYGVAGIMGNLYAESHLIANNLQETYEVSLGVNDEQYTSQVDSGARSEYSFVHDSAGYGIAQWTYYSRKQDFYNAKKKANCSIGNLEFQVAYLLEELAKGYGGTLAKMKTATSVYEASTAFLLEYERPANQSASVQAIRASYSQNYYDKYAKGGRK